MAGALTLPEGSEAALRLLARAWRADAAMLLRGEGTAQLRLAAQVGPPWDEEQLPEAFLVATYGQVFRQGGRCRLGPGEEEAPGAVLGVPLKLGPKALGGLFLTRKPSASAFSDEEEEALAIMGSAMAVQLEALDHVRRTSKRRAELEAIHAAVVDGIVVVDRRGFLQGFNEAFKRLSLTPAHELYAWRWTELLQARAHPQLEARAQLDAFFEAVFLGEAHLAMGVPAWLRRPDGEDLPVALALATIEEEGQVQGGVISVRDVRLEVQMEQMKDDFIATVSHDLRTPLTSMNGFVELLRHHELPRAETLPLLDLILDEGRRLDRMIADLLDLSKIQSGRIGLSLQRLKVAKLLERALEAFRLRHGHAHPISWEVHPPGGSLVGDRDRLLQVLENLVGNAIKYSPGGGAVQVRAHKAGAWWRLEVEDQGMGVPEADLPKLFGRFFRVDEQQGRGSGLGLFIAKTWIEAHGGRIEVRSRLGEGSCFTVHLPSRPLSPEQQALQQVAPEVKP